MSQQTLAEKVGVTRQTIIAIEKDKYSPSLEVAFKISNEFSVALETVFNYKQNPLKHSNIENYNFPIQKTITFQYGKLSVL